MIQNGEQVLVAVHIMVSYLTCGNIIEEFLCTGDFGLLDGAKLQAFHSSLGFGNEEDVLHGAGIKGNCPVGGVVTHGGGNVESFRELSVDTDFVGGIQTFGKFAFDALLRSAIGEHIVLHGFISLECLIEVLAALVGGEDAAVVAADGLIVGDMLDDHGGFLLIDEPDDFGDKLFRIVLEHEDFVPTQAGEDPGNSAPGQDSTFRNLSDEIVLDATALGVLEGLSTSFGGLEGIAPLHLVPIHGGLLLSHGGCVLQLRYHQLVVDVGDGLTDQLVTVEGNRVGILVIDLLPKLLEFLAVEVIIQRIVLDLGIVTVGEHILQRRIIEDGLDQLMDTVAHVGDIHRQRCQRAGSQISAIAVRDPVAIVCIVVDRKIFVNLLGHSRINDHLLAIDHDGFAGEILDGSSQRTVIENILDIGLKVRNESLVALAGDDGQHIDIVDTVAAGLLIHAVALLVNAQAQAAAHLLPFSGLAVRVLQGADLEDIGIVPALPEGGVGEDEPGGFPEAQQPLLVLQNQIVGGNIVGELTAPLQGTVDTPAGFLIDAEIAPVDAADVVSGRAQIVLVFAAVHGQILVENGQILLLEHPAVFAQHLVAVFIVLAVFADHVDKEQGQGLDALLKEGLFLFKVGEDGLTDLDAAHIGFGNIADYHAGADGFAVGEGDGVACGIDFGDGVALVLLHLLGNIVEVIADTQDTGFPVDALAVTDLQLHAGHRGLLGGEDDLLQEEVLVCTPEISDLETLDLDLFDQLLVEGIQGIQNINRVVLLGVGCGVVQTEEGIEPLQRLLGGGTLLAHLLGFVQNEDGPVGGNDIDGPTGAEFVPFGIDDPGFLALAVLFQGGGEGLGVDDHHIDAGAGGEIVQLIQIGAVVDKETGLLVVVLHEVVSGNLEGFLDTFPDGDAGDDYDELAPAVPLVQLEHGLDVDIGLAGAGFHLNVQRTAAQILHQSGRLLDVAGVLDGLNVPQELIVGQTNGFVFIAGVVIEIDGVAEFIGQGEANLLTGLFLALVTDVADLVVQALTGEYTDDRFNCIGLVLLNFEVKLHIFHPPQFLEEGKLQFCTFFQKDAHK